MLKSGILNPQLNSLLSRVRHTNTLVIADRGFPFWPEIETVDLSLVDGIPTVLEVLQAIRANFVIGKAWMAEEFLRHNSEETRAAFAAGAGRHPAAARAARRIQEARAAGDRADPHRRHDPIRQYDHRVGVRGKGGRAEGRKVMRSRKRLNADLAPRP